jgi:hypothetical protein
MAGLNDSFSDSTDTHWYARSRGYTKATDGHDRVGGDLQWTAYDGTDITNKPVGSLDECKKVCTAVDDCIGISYRDSDKNCYIKNNTASQLKSVDTGYQWYAKNPLT